MCAHGNTRKPELAGVKKDRYSCVQGPLSSIEASAFDKAVAVLICVGKQNPSRGGKKSLDQQEQLEVTELCALYTSALGNLQNEADRLLQGDSASTLDPMADTFAEQVVSKHREFERLAAELERAYRPEAEQLRVLAELQSSSESPWCCSSREIMIGCKGLNLP